MGSAPWTVAVLLMNALPGPVLLRAAGPGMLTTTTAERTAMLVVMNSHATQQQIDAVLAAIRRMNLTPHPMPGATRTAIGITGNISAVDPRTLEVLPGVAELIRVTKPYKLASREMHEADAVIEVPGKPGGSLTRIGPA